jgi:hypothetical protein
VATAAMSLGSHVRSDCAIFLVVTPFDLAVVIGVSKEHAAFTLYTENGDSMLL